MERDAVRPSRAPRIADPEEGVDWRRLSGVLLRFKWLIAGVTLASTAGGVVASRFVKPRYAAQATVWIDESDRRSYGTPDRGPLRPGQTFEAEAWVALLRSYAVLDSVAHDLRLYLSFRNPADSTLAPDFSLADRFRLGSYEVRVDLPSASYVLSAADGTELERGALGDSIGTRLGFRWAPGAVVWASHRRVQFTVSSPRDGARWLAEALDAHIDEDGNFLTLQLEGPNPQRLAAIVNALAARYVAVAADLQRLKLTERAKILGQQVTYAQQSLQQAEQALQSFRQRTITLPGDLAEAPGASDSSGASGSDPAGGGAVADFFQMQLERDGLRRDRDAINRILTAASDSGVDVDRLAAINAVEKAAPLGAAVKEWTAKEADLRALRYRYSDAHPRVAQLAGEIATLEKTTIPDLARELIARLDVRARDLDQRLAGAGRQLRAIPARSMEAARVRRDYALRATLFTNLQQRLNEAQLAAATTVPDVRILDPAVVPERPARDTAPRLIVMAFLGGLVAAACGAVLLDRMDPRVRYPAQVSRDMGLAILGTVPHVRLARRDALLLPEDEPAFLEAMRGIRMNLEYAYGSAGPVVFALTSPGPGDGKSLIASNLAAMFAEGSHRTLLIDGDIRRGVLHRRCGGQRRPGLADCLRGAASLEQIIQRTPYERLDLIACGTRAHEAPELLDGPGMPRLLAQLRPNYDVIVCDSPPLTAGIDPFVLGTATGNLLVVLRTGVSHREVIEAKLEVLDRMPVRLLGAVLNDVPDNAAYGYYSYYLPGYEAGDERDERAVAPGPAALS
ncbi:MAG TPA: polysaccharide biosynthesis tyrosine autokinase [Gemmatimonadales bacterium]